MENKFYILYKNSVKYLVREDPMFPYHYLISDGESHIGGGKLLKIYCVKV